MLFLRPKELSGLDWLEAGTATRCAFPEKVKKSEMAEMLPALLSLEPGWSLHRAEQVHRAEVAQVPGSSDGDSCAPGADGLWTGEAEKLLLVYTADCLPVLLVDMEGRRLALLHAGRQSTEEGICPRAVADLLQAGASAENLRAWIGPAVCFRHYEVSKEIADRFQATWPDCPDMLTGPEARHLNLQALNRWQLVQAGLEPDAVEVCDLCTVEEKELLHSYRRDGSVAGRLLTFAGVRG